MSRRPELAFRAPRSHSVSFTFVRSNNFTVRRQCEVDDCEEALYRILAIIGLLAVGSCFTFWQMAQIIHEQRVAECRTQEMKASYEILSAASQINGALRGYIIARLVNDPERPRPCTP